MNAIIVVAVAIVVLIVLFSIQQKQPTLTFNIPKSQPKVEIVASSSNKPKMCTSCLGGNSAAVTNKFNALVKSSPEATNIENQVLQIDPMATIGPDGKSLYRVANTKEAYPLPTGSGDQVYDFSYDQPETGEISRNHAPGAIPAASQTSYKFKDYSPENYDQKQTGTGNLDPNSLPELTIVSPTGEESRITQKYNFRNLQAKYSWEDFHATEGQRITAPGTQPTFGLWTSFSEVPDHRSCKTYSMPARWNNSCWRPELALYGNYGG